MACGREKKREGEGGGCRGMEWLDGGFNRRHMEMMMSDDGN